MENPWPDEKVIIEAFRDAKKLYLGGGGGGGGGGVDCSPIYM